MIAVLNDKGQRNCNMQFQFHQYTLSVLIGKDSSSDTVINALGLIKSENVEIAILTEEGEFVLPQQIIGHQSIDALSRVMSIMRNKHNDEEILVNNILSVID